MKQVQSSFFISFHKNDLPMLNLCEVFVNNINLTFLSVLYKISMEVSQKIKLPPVGIELTTLTITGLQV